MVTSDLARVGAPRPTKKLSTITGAEAKAHLEREIAKSPSRKAEHEKTVREMRAKGYTPASVDRYLTRIEATEPPLPLQRVASFFLPSLTAQSFSDGDGEVDYSPWDNGNPAIFTSETFIEQYSNGDFLDGSITVDESPDQEPQLISASGYYLRMWFICSVTGCGTAMTACALTGPGWATCSGAWCVGAEVGCGLGALAARATCRSRNPDNC
jgi:hypothetical protein